MATQSNRPTRVKQLHVVPRGAGGKGHESALGSGDYVPVQIVINTSKQTVDALEVVDTSGNILFAVSKTGAITSGVPGSAAGLSAIGTAKAIYNFAVDGGASCTPAQNATIPANAILIGATINPTTAPLAVGSATVAIGTTAGSASNSILTATGKASLSIDALVNGTVTLAAPVKMSAAGQISITVATGPLTAGVLEITVYYILAAAA